MLLLLMKRELSIIGFLVVLIAIKESIPSPSWDWVHFVETSRKKNRLQIV